MTRLDRYVARIAVGAFAAALAFFLFLAILFHLLDNLSKYANTASKHGLGGLEFAAYLGVFYLKLVPVLVTTVSPFATAIACMFAVARLQQASEVVPMLFVGRSIQRILRPMLWIGIGSGLTMAACWQWVVPRVGADLLATETFLEGNPVQKNVLHEAPDKSHYFFVREFNAVDKTLTGVTLLLPAVLAADVTLTRAASAVWDEQRRDWRLVDGWLVRMGVDTRVQWLGRPDLTPELLVQTCRDTIDPEMLSYSDLRELAVTRPNQVDVRLAFHRHLTWPLANLLLLLLVLPMAVHYERGGRISRVLYAIGLCGGYMLLDLTCQSLGQRNLFHPVVMAWTPPIFFGSLGLVLFGSMRT